MSRTAPVVKLRNARAVNLDVTSLTLGDVAVTASAAELNLLDGLTDTAINKLTEIEAGAWAVQSLTASFTENGAGTYTGAVTVPAGATILDIVIIGGALWAAATSAAMDVGDVTDPNGYFAGIDLKATDLLAGESISFALAGGKAGAYIANSQVTARYSATEHVISGVVVSQGAGTTGRTFMIVVYSLPGSTTAATKA